MFFPLHLYYLIHFSGRTLIQCVSTHFILSVSYHTIKKTSQKKSNLLEASNFCLKSAISASAAASLC